MKTIDAIHRKQFRKITGINWEDKIINEGLYQKFKAKSISEYIHSGSWRLCDHVIRRERSIPVQLAMEEYFPTDCHKYCGKTPTSMIMC